MKLTSKRSSSKWNHSKWSGFTGTHVNHSMMSTQQIDKTKFHFVTQRHTKRVSWEMLEYKFFYFNLKNFFFENCKEENLIKEFTANLKKLPLKNVVFIRSEKKNLGSVSPTVYKQLLHMQIQKVQKETIDLTVFLCFWNLHS